MALLLAPDELKVRLATCGAPVQYASGKFLFRRGDAGSGVFLVSSGVVRLGIEGEPAAFPARLAEAGSVLGLPAVLSGSPYSLTAKVLEDAELVFVTREDLLELLREQHDLCFQVMRILTEELAQTRSALEHVHRTRS